MRWFKDLRLRVKLILGFVVVIFLVAGLSVFAILTLLNIDLGYTNLLENPVQNEVLILDFRSTVREMRRAVTSMFAYVSSDDSDKINSDYDVAIEARNQAAAFLDNFETNVNNNASLTAEEKSGRINMSSELKSLLGEYENVSIVAVRDAALTYDFDTALAAVNTGATIGDSLRVKTDELLGVVDETVNTISDENTVTTNTAIMILIAISVAVVILSILISLFISAMIQKPVRMLVDVADNVAKGNLNVNIDTSTKDEMGMLAKSFQSVVTSVTKIIEDINMMDKHHEDGEMRYQINAEEYQGSYKEVAEGVNTTVSSYVGMVDDVFGALESYGKGNFSYKLKQYEGEKAVANRQMDLFRDTISKIIEEIGAVAKSGTAGELGTRANADAYQGEWRNIVQGLNDVLEAVVVPIEEIQSVLNEMSKGRLDVSVTGDYQGSFGDTKKAMNKTIAGIAGYINEIADILSKMADGDLRVSIEREYVGSYSVMRESINSIVKTLNKTMTEILSASEQVLSGSKQISTTSMTLAEGASEQASAIQELTASIETINTQTQQNAQNAGEANILSDRSTAYAQNGNAEMQKMLESMNKIQDSSNSISRVIKTISDIAFQTNLLALNASVEAARAGEHGRGFAVVAGEVRNLATKSQTSADDTSQLIEDSNSRVNDGTKIAESTAESLKVIVDNAAQVSGIITTIANASKEQAEAVSQVSIGLSQISQVVQNNSSTSEESAAAAQELNSQAELLKQMVSYFKI